MLLPTLCTYHSIGCGLNRTPLFENGTCCCRNAEMLFRSVDLMRREAGERESGRIRPAIIVVGGRRPSCWVTRKHVKSWWNVGGTPWCTTEWLIFYSAHSAIVSFLFCTNSYIDDKVWDHHPRTKLTHSYPSIRTTSESEAERTRHRYLEEVSFILCQ